MILGEVCTAASQSRSRALISAFIGWSIVQRNDRGAEISWSNIGSRAWVVDSAHRYGSNLGSFVKNITNMPISFAKRSI
jgi:hypothetical protein